MNKKLTTIVTIFSLLVTACGGKQPLNSTGLGYQAQIPELPAELAIKARSLPPITDNTMGGTQIQGAQDDAAYNAVAHQLNKVIDIYNCVRKSINNREQTITCQ